MFTLFIKHKLSFISQNKLSWCPPEKFVDWIISHLPLQSCNFFACLVPAQGKVCLNCIYRCVYYKYLSDVFRFEPTNFDCSKTYKNPFIFSRTVLLKTTIYILEKRLTNNNIIKIIIIRSIIDSSKEFKFCIEIPFKL